MAPSFCTPSCSAADEAAAAAATELAAARREGERARAAKEEAERRASELAAELRAAQAALEQRGGQVGPVGAPAGRKHAASMRASALSSLGRMCPSWPKHRLSASSVRSMHTCLWQHLPILGA